MKNIINKLKKSILIYTLIYLVIFQLLKIILNNYCLNYREWVYFSSFIILRLGFFIGIIQMLFWMKKNSIKIVAIVFIFIIVLSPYIFYNFIFGLYSFRPEHIIMKDGKKMVAYVDAFKETYVEYYDYKNIFLTGAKIVFKENYGKGGFNPFENNFGYEYNIISTDYYDENGNILDTKSNESDNLNINNKIEKHLFFCYNFIITY